jgi:hypothetical protein
VPIINVMLVLLVILLMDLLLHVKETNQKLLVLQMEDFSSSKTELVNVIFYLCLFTFLVCDGACGECDYAANNCTSCPDGSNPD